VRPATTELRRTTPRSTAREGYASASRGFDKVVLGGLLFVGA
jgi:hypothetical protein